MQPKHEITHLIGRKEVFIGKFYTFADNCLKPLIKKLVKYTVMKTLLRNFEIGSKRLFSKVSFMALSAFLLAYNAMADSGPSIQHLKKNLDAGAVEAKRLAAEEAERIAHETLMQNVYMVVGFTVVIAIAWFSTTLALKYKKKEVAVTRQQVLKQSSINSRYPNPRRHPRMNRARR